MFPSFCFRCQGESAVANIDISSLVPVSCVCRGFTLRRLWLKGDWYVWPTVSHEDRLSSPLWTFPLLQLFWHCCIQHVSLKPLFHLSKKTPLTLANFWLLSVMGIGPTAFTPGSNESTVVFEMHLFQHWTSKWSKTIVTGHQGAFLCGVSWLKNLCILANFGFLGLTEHTI